MSGTAQGIYHSAGSIKRFAALGGTNADELLIDQIDAITGTGTAVVNLFTSLVAAGDTINLGGGGAGGSVVDIGGDLQVSGDETVVGDTTFEGNTQIGNAATDTLDVQADIISDLAFDGTNQAVTNDGTGTLGLLKSGASGDLTVSNAGTVGNVVLSSTNGVVQVAAGALDINTSIDFDGTGADFLASAGISIDAGAASNFNTSAGALTLGGVGVFIAGGSGEIDLTTTGAVDINATTTVTIDGGTSVSINGGDIFSDGTNVVINSTSVGDADYPLNIKGLNTTNDTEMIYMTNNEVAPAVAGIHVYSGDPDADNITGVTGDICLSEAGAPWFCTGTTNWSQVGSATGNSLQAAYVAGNAIQLSDANGDMTIDVDDTSTVANFIVQNEAQTAQYLATDATNTQLELGHANITVGFIGEVDTNMVFETSTGAKAITTDGTNGLTLSTATSGTLAITGVAALDMDGTVVTLDGSTSIAAASAGAFDIDAAGALSLNSSAGVINVGNDAVAQNINIGGAGARTITIGSAGATEVQIDADLIDLNSDAGVTIDGATASNFTTAAGALTLDGAGGLLIQGNAAEIDVTTSGALDLNSGAYTLNCSTGIVTASSTYDVDAAGALSLNSSGAAINIGDDAIAQAINIGGAGARTITIGSAGATEVQIDADLIDLNSDAAVTIDAAAASNFTVAGAFDLTFGARSGSITLNQSGDTTLDAFFVNATSIIGALNELADDVTGVTGTYEIANLVVIAVGDLCYLNDVAGEVHVDLADGDSGVAEARIPIGIALTGGTGDGSATAEILLAGEGVVNSALVVGDVGNYIFMSDTAGAVVNAAGVPSTTGDTVLRVGICSLSGAGGTAKIKLDFGTPFTL